MLLGLGLLAIALVEADSSPLLTDKPDSRPRLRSANKPQIAEAYGKLPLSFEANQGQTDSRVDFLARGSGYSLFLSPTEAVLALRKPVGVQQTEHTAFQCRSGAGSCCPTGRGGA